MEKALILGVGNLILKDEGVGVHLARGLDREDFPPEVEIIDGGTSTLDLLPVICETDRIIVIDALKAGGRPGTIYRVFPEDIMHVPDRPLSIHQLGLLDVILMARQLGGDPYVVIFGVEPKEISWGLDLTREVEDSLPKIVEAIFGELKGMGYARVCDSTKSS